MSLNISPGLAADARGVDALRATAARDPKAAIKEAAKQFEALFMRELMKSMRQATQSSGLLDNSTTELGTEMLDSQFAQQMTGLRGGLSEAIARHLERQMGVAPGTTDNAADGDAGALPPAPAARSPLSGSAPAPMALPDLSATQIGFVQQHAQAAHESGWGQQPIRHADGRSAHNLFGIKAGAGWKGEVAEITTTEVIDGQAHKVKAKFRAYATDAESFGDYARLVSANPRYSRVLSQSGSAQGFAQELQRAGYATDPHYADKLTRTLNTTLRVQRAVG